MQKRTKSLTSAGRSSIHLLLDLHKKGKDRSKHNSVEYLVCKGFPVADPNRLSFLPSLSGLLGDELRAGISLGEHSSLFRWWLE
jgi:hypothetical protein